MTADEGLRDSVAQGPGIDRSSPVPLYHQLEELLRQEIDGGRYPPGSLLPSEGEICALYEVSRSVVRQTFTNLVHAGLIRTERGRGSFVCEPKVEEGFVQRPIGLHDDLHQMGYSIRTHVLLQERTRLPRPARVALGVDQGVQIDRVRSVDGRVLAYIRTYLRADRCPGLEDANLENRSLYAYLSEHYDLRPRQGRRTVEAVVARGDVARHLEVDEGEPLLLLRSSSTAQDGEPLEWYEAWHRADRTAFALDIGPSESGSVASVMLEERDPAATTSARLPTAAVEEGAAERLIETMTSSRVIAVLRSERYEGSSDIAAALVDHGFPLVEITLTGSNALEAIAEAARTAGAVVGAGSVLDPSGARSAIEAGASFLVSPIYAPEVVAASRVPVILAGLTPSEIWAAWKYSKMPVKVFPAFAGGPGLLRAVHGPMPDVPLLPSGGIDLDNVGDYLDAGALAVNIGSSLVPPAAIERGDVGAIAQRAAMLRQRLDSRP